jgi:hypothetical protein
MTDDKRKGAASQEDPTSEGARVLKFDPAAGKSKIKTNALGAKGVGKGVTGGASFGKFSSAASGRMGAPGRKGVSDGKPGNSGKPNIGFQVARVIQAVVILAVFLVFLRSCGYF